MSNPQYPPQQPYQPQQGGYQGQPQQPGYPNQQQPPYQQGGYQGQPQPGMGYQGQPNMGYSQAPVGYAPQQGYGYPMGGGALSMPKASFGQRLGAWVIDGILMGILATVIYIIGAVILFAGATTSTTTDAFGNTNVNVNSVSGGSVVGFLISILLAVLLPALYYIILVGRGQTLGNKAVGMRIITADGSAPGIGKAILRLIVQSIVGGIFFLSYLWMLWDPEQQTLHDKVAGTYGVAAR